MSPEDWQQVKAIFNSVLDVDEGERSAHLAKACGGNEELRRKVEELLRSYETGFMEDAAHGDTASDGLRLAAGRRLGRY